MSYREASILKNLDWALVILLTFLVFFGWVNIISATSNIEFIDWFDWNGKAGKQLLWIGICAVFAFTIVNIDPSIEPALILQLIPPSYLDILFENDNNETKLNIADTISLN